MQRLLTGTAIATLLATAAASQTAPTDPAADPATAPVTAVPGEQGFFQLEEGNALASHLMGIQAYAMPEDAQIDTAAIEAGTMPAADIAGFVPVGQISDIVMGSDHSVIAFVMAGLVDDTTMQQEVVIEAQNVRFVVDDTVPTLWWAIVDMTAEEFMTAPLMDRMQQPVVGTAAAGTGAGTGVAGTPATTGTAPGVAPGTGVAPTGAEDWRMGRTTWGAPAVGLEGYQAVPVDQISAQDLMGAQVFGIDNINIGSIGDIVIGEEGDQISYAVIDVGGFLGIGSREVAIGFDEMTILHDVGWNDLQVHVNATQETIETAPALQR